MAYDDDYNVLESAASSYFERGDYENAIRIYIYMAYGDTGLDGEYLGERLGECYEMQGKLNVAKYWYERAFYESGESRLFVAGRLDALKDVGIDDIVSDFKRK
jgi:tetratricopeptide (TPR) repeat protein